MIAGVDWFRGAITTIPNVACDALVALIIAKDEGEFNRDIFDGKITIDEYNAQMGSTGMKILVVNPNSSEIVTEVIIRSAKRKIVNPNTEIIPLTNYRGTKYRLCFR